MGSITPTTDTDPQPELVYPAPLEANRDAGLTNTGTNDDASIDIECPILIVGGGPVGMLQALMLARLHKLPSVLIERELSTTTFPKMEYTNGRSMEIYRMMGLSEDVRAMGNQYVPDSAKYNEINVTSLVDSPNGGPKAKLIHPWNRPSADDLRVESVELNDGTRYLEPHMRCHQIPVEAWLKKKIEEHKHLIEGHWGWKFVGLEEKEDGVVVEVNTNDGRVVRIKSRYVIGTDGGGSFVRKSVGLEAKRNYMELSTAFAHIQSKALRRDNQFGEFWHANVLGGGIVVSQNEDDLFTCHLMLPPGGNAADMTPEELVGATMGGCNGPHSVKIDKFWSRGHWHASVAIATSFRSEKGRVFLAGDSAHQLSPVGGHGLNSGLADAFDLAWKLAARIQGWGSEQLLDTYDTDRRAIAHKNLNTVKEAIETIVAPCWLIPVQKFGKELLAADTREGEAARKEVEETMKPLQWFHNQNGNMLGYQYQDAGTVITEQETTERPISDKDIYLATTYPGSRLPHVWMQRSPKKSTLDYLKGDTFSVIDFSTDDASGKAFESAARDLGVPLQALNWHGEANVRKIYERDVVLVRPDMHVSWRIGEQAEGPVSAEEARSILSRAVGR